ncbi:glycosyltransferase [Candidatus Woesearchaeota archaeon]|nr:glycosyltransferase [Candidatus Woesearchaeota archaeon]
MTLLFLLCHWDREYNYRTKPAQGALPTVDVFVTCYNEPIGMIGKTLYGASVIDYPLKQVYLLDDGNREELRKLARGLGVQYLSRPSREHAKAGNLNYGLQQSASPFVLTLDADQVPDSEILKELMGYFEEPAVAFVTTRQRFDVHDRDFNHDHLFYEHMQAGKNKKGCPISCGSGVIYRRAALEKIGGFVTWNLVEDLTTSYELHKRGLKSVYVNKPYTTGLAPQDIKNIYKQRGTWAADSLRIFFRKNPLFAKGLSVHQRLHYLEMTYHYLVSGVFIPILFIMPAVSLLLNYSVVNAGYDYLFIRLPGLLAVVWFYSWLNHGSENNQFWVSMWPVYLGAVFLALHPKKRPYRVTEKIERAGRRLKHVLPQMIVLGAGVVGIFLNVFQHGPSANWAINTAWIALEMWWVMPIIKLATAQKHRHIPTLHKDVTSAYA